MLVTRLTGGKSPELTDMVVETLRRDLPEDYKWPGNVRELEQAIRRILLTRHYDGDLMMTRLSPEADLLGKMQSGSLEAMELLCQYCALLYRRFGTYEEVARRTRLDRRTVKKYIQMIGSDQAMLV
jgi:transcriptional regulator with PAS, ATPase and Fis domain